ncbi:MAG: YeeE/YedE family protein [Bacteroidetes bacterium]|nr:YeeE/YedE family protein [Bacteroidota bacterium]
MQTNQPSSNKGGLFSFWLLGILFGIILIKAEVVSWWRIQEMFRLQNFHMFGVIGSAIATGMLSLFLIKKLQIKTLDGEPIAITPKKFQKGNIYGGLLFGFGWAMTGACPGPLFALLGNGSLIIIIPLCAALLGTKVYGMLAKRLPH